jgi:hypothetical protein
MSGGRPSYEELLAVLAAKDRRIAELERRRSTSQGDGRHAAGTGSRRYRLARRRPLGVVARRGRRQIATRYDKKIDNDRSFVWLVALLMHLK